MAGRRVPCTCGCGLEVTYATKQNHLNARGKTSLRARVVTEVKSLKRNTQQQRKPSPLLQNAFRKRASSDLDQDGSRKRHKAVQLVENQLPQITVDTDLIENLLPPVVADTDRQSRFIERSRGVMGMRWMTSRRDGGSHPDGKGDDNDGRDDEEKEDEDGDEDEEDEEEEDEDEEDKDGEDKDEEDGDGDGDGDEPPYDSEIPGISNWDLLGEDFERKAAALGLYFSYELPT
jgi:cobalamin biosynthesis protein CobT